MNQLLHLGVMQVNTSVKPIVAMDSSENAVSPAISNILNTVRCLRYSNFAALINVAADLKTTVDIFGLILINTAILREIVLNLSDT